MSQSHDNRRVVVLLSNGMHIMVGTTADMKKEIGIEMPEALEGVSIEGSRVLSKPINVRLMHQDDRYVLYKEVA